jgi:TP901 family phage tail tape measure protein
MGGENLLLSLWVRAHDMASPIIAKLGLTSGSIFGAIGVAAAGVIGGIAAIGVASTVMASKFDQNMHKVYALTNTSADQMAWYKQQILALSPAIDVSAADLANGLYFVVSAGFKGQQAMDVLRYSAMAAAAGMTDMKGVADAVTSVMNAYRSSALSAGTATDVLERLVANGKVEFSQIASSIGFTATTAAAAGIKVQEMAAAVSALTQVAGAHGARRVQMEFDNLARSVGIDQVAVAERAKKLGLAFDENKFALMSFIDKMKYLATISGGVGYLNQTQAAAYMATGNFTNLAAATAKANSNFKNLVGGAAAFIPAYILLNDKGKMYNSILAQMNGTGNYTQRSFDRMRESTGQLWKMFELAGQSILITLGEQILPTVNNILKAFIPMLRGVTAFLATKEGMVQFKLALAAIAAVAGGILVTALGMAVVAGSPLIIMIGIFLGTIAAIIALGVGINKVVEHFGGWNAVMQKLQPLLTFLKNTITQVGNEFKRALADPQLKSALAQLQQAFTQLKPLLILVAVVVGVALFLAFQNIVAVISGFLGMLPGLIMLFSGVMNVIGGLARIIVDIFTGKWSDILPALKQVGIGILQIIVGALMAVLGFLGGFFGHILSLFGLSWGKLGAMFGALFGHIGEAVGGFFSNLGTQIHARLAYLGALWHIGLAAAEVLVHAAFERIKAAFLAPFQFIANSTSTTTTSSG